MLSALQDKLMRKDFFEEFCREFAKEMNRLRMEQRAGLSSAKRDLERVKRDIKKVIDAIKAGYAGPELKAEMDDLQARKNALLAQLATADEPPPLLHPSMGDLYRSKVEELASALQREDTRLEASEMLRGLIHSIVLTPEKGLPGSENSDHVLSGNSDHVPVALPGQKIVGGSASDEGKDDRHAQATRGAGTRGKPATRGPRWRR